MNKADRAARDERNRAMLQRITMDRIAQGVCRHCGGRVPCWSEDFGDVAVGVKHPRKRTKRAEANP